jgi:NAD(P) transhydrogenase subunit alpha
VKIVGHHNVPGRIAEDASKLFARNLLSFLTPMIDKDSKSLKIDMADEIVAGTLITRDGAVVHPKLAGTAPAPEKNAETATKGE